MLKARAAEALRELVDLTGIHVVTTLMARGVFPTATRSTSACPACTATATATTALQKATC